LSSFSKRRICSSGDNTSAGEVSLALAEDSLLGAIEPVDAGRTASTAFSAVIVGGTGVFGEEGGTVEFSVEASVGRGFRLGAFCEAGVGAR
jgi:hypothetical protein